MPFTFSHPAIILPLMKINHKYVSATALVAGSMAPDFEYFIHMRMHQVHGHTLGGILYFDLPLTLLLCFLFHQFVRDSMLKYSPIPLRQELHNFHNYNWPKRFREKYLVIIISALIGISSHLFWDSFTHANRFFVNMIPFLQEKSSFFGIGLRNHDWAQLLFSVIGAIAMAMAVFKPLQMKFIKKEFRSIIIYWSLVILVLITILFLRNTRDLSTLLATAISGGLIGLMSATILMEKLKLETKSPNRG